MASFNNEGDIYTYIQYLKEAFLIQTRVFAGQYQIFFPFDVYLKFKRNILRKTSVPGVTHI